MEDIFADIRPYNNDELPAVLAELCENEQFKAVIAKLMPQMPTEMVLAQMKTATSATDFQRRFVMPVLDMLLQKITYGFTYHGLEKSPEPRLYVTNHRDIVIDSALIDYAHAQVGNEAIQLGIGDNLMSLPWVKTLMLINKGFIVKRNLPKGEMIAALKQLSSYLHHVICELGDSIWIAQREGRAKDSDDRTQESILKMFALAGEGSFIDNLKALNISPVSLSYEYDPCDFLKAKEFQQKRDDADFKKSAHDDVVSMQTGIMGFKGHVHYEFTPSINSELDKIAETIENRKEQVTAVAQLIDRRIHANYAIYPINKVAYDELFATDKFASEVSVEERQIVLDYFEKQLAKVDLPNPDYAFLRQKMLEMYANPLKNHLAAQ